MLYIGLFFESVREFDRVPDDQADGVDDFSTSVPFVPDPGQGQDQKWNTTLGAFLNRFSIEELSEQIGISTCRIVTEARRQRLTVSLSPGLESRLGKDKVTEMKQALLNHRTAQSIQKEFHVSAETLTRIVLSERKLLKAIEMAPACRKAQRIQFHRDKILEFLRANERVYRVTLIRNKRLNGSYTYLMRHDRQWLESVLRERPPMPSSRPHGRQIDWKARDREFSNQVRIAVRRLQRVDGKPVMLSKERILLAAGITPSVLTNSDGRLPRTEKALQRSVESRDEFNRRRIRLGIEKLASDGDPVTMFRLSVAAGMVTPLLWKLYAEIERVCREVGADLRSHGRG